MLDNNFYFGIRSKLLAPIIIGFSAFIILIIFQFIPYILENENKHFIESHKQILKTLTPSIIQNLLSQDYATLFSNINYTMELNRNEWKYLEVYDHTDKRIYPLSGKPPTTDENIFLLSYELNDAGESLGYLNFYIDWSGHKNEYKKVATNLTHSAILFFSLLMIASIIWQTYWFIKPIRRLQNAATKISKGQFDTILPTSTNDEIGFLSESFILMQENIQAYQSNLKQTLTNLANEEKRQRAILDTAPDAIITLDKRGIIQSFNYGAENIFKYTSDEVIGESIKILMPADIANSHDHYMSGFNNTNSSVIIGKSRELFGKKKNGEKFPIDLSINAKEIDNELLFTGVLRDITERKKVDRLKSEFVATVSHELRTPLTAIKGSLDIVTKGLNLELPEQALTMLDVANRNVERLLTLINDILDISKLESGEINFVIETVEIKPFIKNITDMNQEYAKKYNTTFKCIRCDNDVSIKADKDRLDQVMSNLLSNAAKYSPKNVPVEVFTTLNKGMIRINVKDYGPGIPENFQDSVFEKFTQSDSGDTRQVGGTGLGLNISKMIIEKLGGRIGFETTIGKETTFYFELPVISKV